MEEKTINNNKLTFIFKNEKISSGQLDLNGEQVSYPPRYGLSRNGYQVLETFYLVGPENSYALLHLKNLFNGQMHPNTVNNQVKELLSKKLIRELPIIPKRVINNLYLYKEIPAMLEDGTPVKDIRRRFYSITDEGMKVFELNKKLWQSIR